MMSGKYTVHDLQAAIKEKYGTQKAYADFLGITEQSLSKRLARASSKFIFTMKQHGIKLDEELPEEDSAMADKIDNLLELVLQQQVELNNLRKEVDKLRAR